jgi:hypothetical protein
MISVLSRPHFHDPVFVVASMPSPFCSTHPLCLRSYCKYLIVVLTRFLSFLQCYNDPVLLIPQCFQNSIFITSLLSVPQYYRIPSLLIPHCCHYLYLYDFSVIMIPLLSRPQYCHYPIAMSVLCSQSHSLRSQCFSNGGRIREQRWIGLEPMHVAIKLGCIASISCDAQFGINREGQMDRRALAIIDIENLYMTRYVRSNAVLLSGLKLYILVLD